MSTRSHPLFLLSRSLSFLSLLSRYYNRGVRSSLSLLSRTAPRAFVPRRAIRFHLAKIPLGSSSRKWDLSFSAQRHTNGTSRPAAVSPRVYREYVLVPRGERETQIRVASDGRRSLVVGTVSRMRACVPAFGHRSNVRVTFSAMRPHIYSSRPVRPFHTDGCPSHSSSREIPSCALAPSSYLVNNAVVRFCARVCFFSSPLRPTRLRETTTRETRVVFASECSNPADDMPPGAHTTDGPISSDVRLGDFAAEFSSFFPRGKLHVTSSTFSISVP